MALMAKSDGEGKHFDPVPEGPHIAVCYLVADLGTHHDDRYDKDTHRVLIGWEIPDERITITRDGEELDLPRVISQRYTLSLHEKANLRKDLEAWRGKRFTDKELGGFDLQQVLEVGCQLQVIHTQKEEKTYANIGALMALPKGVKAPKTENEPLWFSFQESTVERRTHGPAQRGEDSEDRERAAVVLVPRVHGREHRHTRRAVRLDREHHQGLAGVRGSHERGVQRAGATRLRR